MDGTTIGGTDAAIVFSTSDSDDKANISLLLPQDIYEKTAGYNCLMAVAITDLLSSGDAEFIEIVGRKVDEILEAAHSLKSVDSEDAPEYE